MAKQRRPARSVGARAVTRVRLIPGPHPTLEVRFNATRLQSNLASPEVVPDSLRSAHARRRRSLPSRPPGAPALRSGGFARGQRQRPAERGPRARWRRLQARLAQQPTPTGPPSPRAPDEPSAALEWSLDRTPSSIRRRRPHRPAQPAVPSREGTPTGHDQHRRPARNPPSVERDLRSAWSASSEGGL